MHQAMLALVQAPGGSDAILAWILVVIAALGAGLVWWWLKRTEQP